MKAARDFSYAWKFQSWTRLFRRFCFFFKPWDFGEFKTSPKSHGSGSSNPNVVKTRKDNIVLGGVVWWYRWPHFDIIKKGRKLFTTPAPGSSISTPQRKQWKILGKSLNYSVFVSRFVKGAKCSEKYWIRTKYCTIKKFWIGWIDKGKTGLNMWRKQKQ